MKMSRQLLVALALACCLALALQVARADDYEESRAGDLPDNQKEEEAGGSGSFSSRSDLDAEAEAASGASRSEVDADDGSSGGGDDSTESATDGTEAAEQPTEQPAEAPAAEEEATTSGEEASAAPAAPDDDLGSCGRVPVYEKPYGRSINRSEIELTTRAETGEKRILYGLDSTVGEWPWIVKLRLTSTDGRSAQACTGTLLNERWVITAAHCLTDAAEAEATLGLYDLVVPDASSVTIKCDKLIKHPESSATHHDLALLRLAEPVQYNDFIGPVCRTPKTNTDLDSLRLAHKFCYTVGYGLNEDMGRPVKLQKLEIKRASCDRLEKEMDQTLTDVACILPRSADQGGTCRGDSGGPDLCYDEHTNRWFIFGVISFGPSDCNRESSDPEDWLTASVDLTKYEQWVRTTMEAEGAD